MIDHKWEKEAMSRRNKIFAAAVIFVLIVLVVIFYRENNKEWMHYQKSYNGKMAALLNDPSYLKAPLKVEQIWLPHFNATDRCMTCHLGVSNPLAIDEPQPFTTHPGDFIKNHPLDKFGCTVCHQGDGQVVSVEETHGAVHHLNRQLLAKEYAQASCSKCHIELHDKSISAREFPGAATFLSGRDLSYQLGCRGCHNINGDGGTIGPELTGLGSKTELAFFLIHDFLHVEGHHTMSHWVYEHFLDPQKIVPGNPELNFAATIMPNYGLTEEQAKSLTIYVLGLRNPKVEGIPHEYIAAKKMVQTSSSNTRSMQ